MLHTIIYASQATRSMSPTALAMMLAGCRDRNQREGVTGLLLYSDRSFLQMLEGEADTIDATFARIQRDPRHTGLRVLARRPITGRSFPDWAMGFEHPDTDELVRLLPGYTPATVRPLVSADLVPDAQVAETVLVLYALNNR